MAGIARDSGGRKRITLRFNGKSQSIRLGKCSLKAAEYTRLRVESIVASRLSGAPLDAETSRWLGAIGDDLHARLVRAGLIEPRQQTEAVTLGDLLDRFVEAASVSPATLAAYRQTTESLREHFGDDKPIDAVTPADADGWRKSLVDDGYARATVAKRTNIAKAIFRKAAQWKLLVESPFDHLRVGSQSNPDRSAYVPRETIEAILDACPNDRWRAIVALVRFAGLRCPSELTRLTWGDVNWDRGRLTVRSPKIAHHEGHAIRVTPISAEVRPILMRLFEQAEHGAKRIIPDLAPASNLRTTFLKIINRAGETPWPRLFHNLRASCATDWCERFPAHAVAKWLGHSPMIAAQHYLQVRDQHFAAAAGIDANGGVIRGVNAAQNVALRDDAPKCAEPSRRSDSSEKTGEMRPGATTRTWAQKQKVGGAGFEPAKA